MKKTIAVFLAICLLLSACGGQGGVSAEKAERSVYAMDTVMSLTVYAPEDTAVSALNRAEMEIYRLDNLLSVSSETGEIYRINRDYTAVVSAETGELIGAALDAAELTNGDFDPTLYPLSQLWGFSSTSPHGYYVPGEIEIQHLLPRIGYEKLHLGLITAGEYAGQYRVTLPLPELIGLDLGGIAKGYTSERVIETLQEAGVESAIISLGGNVGTLGRKPDGSAWTVAIENPEGGDYLGTMTLDGGYFAITSGAYERYFEEDGVIYHHILDPKTGYPADTDLLSVTIVSQNGTLADALSTALFVKGFDGAVAFWRENQADFDMVLVTAEGIFATPGLDLSSENPITEVTP